MTLDNMTGITKGSYTGGDLFCKSQLITCNRVNECNGVCPFEDTLRHADKAHEADAQTIEPTDCSSCDHYHESETEDGYICECFADTAHTDLISRADAIEAVESAYKEPLPISMAYPLADIVGILKALPSADRPNAYADVVNKADNKVYSKISDGEPFGYHSADRPTLKQTDTLIIADALRYLAQDTERHLSDRTRADELREQILAYGASMCPSADRPMGEWQKAYRKTANGVDFRVIECNKCGFADAQMNYYHYCPNCGARMGNDDDDLDGLKIIAIIDGEGGSE